MSSMFTTAERRKKVVTYGKSSRLSTIPPPSPSIDASSSEEPRKLTTASHSTQRAPVGVSEADGARSNGRANSGGLDVFDVPSEDDVVLSRSFNKAKKPPAKRRIPGDEWDVPSSGDEASGSKQRAPKSVKPLRKPEVVKSAAPATKKPQKPTQPQKSAPAPTPSSHNPIASQMRRGKTPQPVQKPEQIAKGGATFQPVAIPKTAPRPRSPAPSVARTKQNGKTTLALPAKNAQVPDSMHNDIFDVPSDEEALMPTRKLPRLNARNKTKQSVKSNTPTTQSTSETPAESDDSNTSKKRKRTDPVSTDTVPKAALERKRDASVSQRNHKHQKKDHSAPIKQPVVALTAKTQFTEPALSKPRRTRQRTEISSRQPIIKSQTSPAKLHNMLPQRQLLQPAPISGVSRQPEVLAEDDITMYDISGSMATPVRTSKATPPGSVTPRQKALFTSLLGESSSTPRTQMPSISALQLSDRKPRSLIGDLARSKSDLTHNGRSRKTRLIDTLKPAETSSEEDDSESDEEDIVEHTPRAHTLVKQNGNTHKSRNTTYNTFNDMDVDVGVAANSQVSQVASGNVVRSKFTYAKQRSYLQETNPEDELLISMDLDDDLGGEFRKKDSQYEEEEEEQTSQVRAHHELRTQGHQHRFLRDTESAIDDIANKSNNSIRRTAMIEFCTKLADESFVGQFLDSSLTRQFFENLASNGEVIFDFAAITAIIFILETNHTSAVVDQIRQSGIHATWTALLSNDTQIQRIAKERKSNLSRIAQPLVIEFGIMVQGCSFWSPNRPENMTPQIVALKVLELMVLELQKAGSTETFVTQDTISTLVDLASGPCERLKSGQHRAQDTTVLELVFSILEAVSVSPKQKQNLWSSRVLQRLADLIPILLETKNASPIMLAIKLCMNLTNNKPKACQPFSGATFVQPLVRSICHRFELLHTGLGQEVQTEVRDSLILSLGAMINLAEFSDQARVHVDDGEKLTATLLKIFLEGSERASQAESIEESHSSVAVGYLTVLLGNLCLNDSVRGKIQAQLPGQQLSALVEKIKEFVRYHEAAHRKAEQFEGEEGQETWQNYTARLMVVVEKLEKAGT
ncbi:hypothetical protein P153DRAFT_342306 [Dothidotthia symphoricarpi CBS 119687]|uniref:Wings apart-like protein C-terminal domain-containing protein n=1 Tax=Dothidotthia symphoricarpi CBS 119687 TaxID=1392245 RepID=A0A6A6AAC5_9PLEO|nr:uncharacterized protein P153DRAFT_342306 [Dothidotthia symphoricarpi CBS 119687]KAF2128516.1 hypothetical protein P153DRAFT_342306 [Dothidotthia symphoricarpi CBS 119687]